jgi:hypothetical protein
VARPDPIQWRIQWRDPIQWTPYTCFDTDPNRDVDGFRHGVLELNKQLVLQGIDVHFLPHRDRRSRRRGARTGR